MSTAWENLRQSVNQFSDKVNTTVDKFADQAALRINLSVRREDLNREYRTLGQLTYEKLSGTAIAAESDADSATADTLTEQINTAMLRITAMLEEIAQLEKKIK